MPKTTATSTVDMVLLQAHQKLITSHACYYQLTDRWACLLRELLVAACCIRFPFEYSVLRTTE